MKQSILRRGDQVTSRWRRAALKIKLRNAAEANAAVAATGGADDNGKGRKGSKRHAKRQVTVVDIARLAVADRDSNIPPDAENVGDDVVQVDVDVNEKTSL